MPTHDLSLSHNHADKAWTERLATAIENDASGPPLKVFFDKWDIRAGMDIPAELEAALEDSRYLGLVLSPESLVSDWVALERFTAIGQDPAAKRQHLIPILHRDCQIPVMLARLKYIDFRRDTDFETSLTELIDSLRGRSNRRGRDLKPSDLQFREDAALLSRHRRIFDRPAFQTPCIWELFLHQLTEAVDDTMAAVNTGSLYSRSGNELASFPDRNGYKSDQFRSAFQQIVEFLQQ